MGNLSALEPKRVFEYFEEICSIPHGSGDMEKISTYCLDFARLHGLKAVRDSANNVIIYKNATPGYEAAAPVILQGHLDMVCQKTPESNVDFEQDGICPYIDGDFVKAKGTTLGADNGIAVAMALAILASDDIAHPAIEALFTTDEETGMYGAMALDAKLLKGKKMLNIDAEEPGTVTVSCAGGSNFHMTMPFVRERVRGTHITVRIAGLLGGHSGIEIHKGRVNADILMGRLLSEAKSVADYRLICVDGGDKGNAIPLSCTAQLVVENPQVFAPKLQYCMDMICREIADREPQAELSVQIGQIGEFDILPLQTSDALTALLLCAPNGVQTMSASIDGLVETSLNLGVLKTQDAALELLFTLRSNKQSALDFLEKRLFALAKLFGCKTKTDGHYPPWEYKADSELRELYKTCYREMCGEEAKVEAIHAGLECGVFASKIADLDCIAIGPALFDVHTVNERLSISSTAQTYELVKQILAACK